MRIGINALLASTAASYRNAGVSHYILSLLQALGKIDHENEYVIFISDQAVARHLAMPPTMAFIPVGKAIGNPTLRVLWEHARLANHVHRQRLDLLHAPVNILPLRLSCPGVVTIHDLAFLRFPEFFRPARRRYQRHFIHQSARRARLIIALSEQTRQDIMELLDVPAERIRVIPPILDTQLLHPREARDVQAFRQRQGLPEHYILFLATLEPRKNLRLLLDAYALLRGKAALPHVLVLAGAKGWYYQELAQHVQASGLQEQVRFVGYVAEEEKPLWYAAADLFVYPSLYEGFGLPVAEAMACGVPVVTTSVSSLPEVVGDDARFGERAALTVPPDDPETLAHAMQRGLLDFALRQQLRERGLARVQRFAPACIAPQIIRAYQDATQPGKQV